MNGASLLAQNGVKNLPAVQETAGLIPGESKDGEDPLEEGMATHSSILAWRIPWAEEPGWLQSIGSQRVRCDWVCTHIDTDIDKRKFIIGNGSHVCGSQEVPQSHLWAGEPGKLIMLIQFEPKGLRMGLRAADVVGPSLTLKAWEPRVSEGQEEVDVSAQAEIELICPSFAFLFYSASQWIGWWPSMFGRAICFTQFANSDANLFQEHPHKHY